MKHFFSLLLLLSVCDFTCGQTITGLVLHEDSYFLNKVKVSINEGNAYIYTDSIGNYSIQINSSTKRIHFIPHSLIALNWRR